MPTTDPYFIDSHDFCHEYTDRKAYLKPVCPEMFGVFGPDTFCAI